MKTTGSFPGAIARALIISSFGFLLIGFASAQIIDPILPPPIRISSPANLAVFHAPVDIPIFAYAESVGTSTARVEFYAGTNKLGLASSLGSTFPIGVPRPELVVPLPLMARLIPVYCLVWTNAPTGSYALTAVTTVSNLFTMYSESRTSAPVNITIVPPSTSANPVDVVSIIATDPIAVASTNSWFWPGVTNAVPAWSNWPPVINHLFTNQGPKDAVFTLRRFGNATLPLTVNYSVGGTASNGVDYVTLPGSVSVPAGAGYVIIPVVPVENNSSNINKSVVLTLTASTNASPTYQVGVPARAAALILENWPRPLPFLLSDLNFHLNAAGPDGAWFCVQRSANLVNWTNICTNQVFQGSINFIDPDASTNPAGLYRVVPLDGLPAQ